MKLLVEIPKEFETHFNNDRFKDSLKRIYANVKYDNYLLLSGKYELELIEMLGNAIGKAEVIEKDKQFLSEV